MATYWCVAHIVYVTLRVYVEFNANSENGSTVHIKYTEFMWLSRWVITQTGYTMHVNIVYKTPHTEIYWNIVCVFRLREKE